MQEQVGQSRRDRRFDATRHEIKVIARRHMAENGAVNISLRAIAREMGMTAPALYRYFANYDELITALIVDAFVSLGDALDAADRAQAPAEYVARFLATALEYRRWAAAHPEEFSLIFGNPIPGYDAPAEVTIPVVRRAFMPFLEIVQAAWQAEQLQAPLEPFPLSDRLTAQLATFRQQLGYDVPLHALHLTVMIWAHGHGLVMLELFGHIPYFEGSVEEMYRVEILAMLKRMGLNNSDH